MEQTKSIRAPLFDRRALFGLILPLVVEQFLAMLVGMADTVMLTSVGEAAVSGVALVDTVNTLMIQILAALTAGGAVVAAQYIGRGDRENASRAGKQLLYLAVFSCTVITAAVLAANRSLLHLIFGSIDPEVLGHASVYLLLTALSFPFLAAYNSCAALFRAMGNSRVSMLASLLMNVINIGGNAILIYGFGLGTAGAGVATLVSRAVSAVLMLLLIRNRTNPIYLRDLRHVRFSGAMVKNILRIGIPSGVENGLFQAGKLILQSLIAGLGTAAIAANAISDTVARLELVPGSAMNLSMITVVGQCMGAGEQQQAKKYTGKLLLFASVGMFLSCFPILLFGTQVAGWFHLSEEATATVVKILPVTSIMQILIWPLSFTFPNALRAAGDAKFTMVISMISMWVLRIGLGYVFVTQFHLGVPGVWYAMYCDWAFRALCFTLRFLSGKWSKKRVIA